MEYFILHFTHQGNEIEIYTINRNNDRVTLIINDFKCRLYVRVREMIAMNCTPNDLISNTKCHFNGSCLKRSIQGYNTMEEFVEFQATSMKEIKEFVAVCKSNFVSCYNGNLTPIQMIMGEKKIYAGCWLSVPVNYENPQTVRVDGVSFSANVVSLSINDISFKECDDIPMLRILTFDIELCGTLVGKKVRYAERGHDPIIDISAVISEMRGTTMVDRWHVFTWRPINQFVRSPHPTAHTKMEDFLANTTFHIFNTEVEMFCKYKLFLLEQRPDIVTGWNINDYDIPTLSARAKVLGVRDFDATGKPHFDLFGRSVVFSRVSVFTGGIVGSVQKGYMKNCKVSYGNVIVLDGLKTAKQDHANFDSFKLDYVLKREYKEGKEDMPYEDIPVYWNGTIDQRTHLAFYCLYDSIGALRFVRDRMKILEMVEQGKAGNMVSEWVYGRGKTIIGLSKICNLSFEEGFVIPYKEQNEEEPLVKKRDAKYGGGTVLDPVTGFYTDPVMVLDFQSLYPSIEIGHNLCFTTYLTTEQLSLFPESDLEKSPDEYDNNGNFVSEGHWFLKKSVLHGMIPRIQMQLAKKRADAKVLMAKAQTPEEKKIYNIRQNAMKLMMNSLYGATGSTFFLIACKAVASATTAYGRMYHKQTCGLIISKCIEMGYPKVQILYGDTDSIFFTIYISDLKKCVEVGTLVGAYVTETINRYPFKLLYEKMFDRVLLIAKKKYGGRKLMENPKSPSGFDISISKSGVSTVKKTSCLLLRETVDYVFDKIINDDHPLETCVKYLKEVAKRIHSVNDSWDADLLNKLKVRFVYGKPEYANKSVITEVVRKKTERDPIPPELGDVFFVLPTFSPQNGKACDWSEDIEYLMKDGNPMKRTDMALKYYVDTPRIINNHFKTSILELFPSEADKKTIFAALTDGIVPVRDRLVSKFNQLEPTNAPLRKIEESKALNVKKTIAKNEAMNKGKKNMFYYLMGKK